MQHARSVITASQNTNGCLPALIFQGTPAARFAYDEFFFGRLRNVHTRRAYRHAVDRFLAWCEQFERSLAQIAPSGVGRYIDSLDCSVATKKLHLAALRHFFDELVLRHVVVLNPAASVRAERLQVIEGTTPEISKEDARRLLESIGDSGRVALRDRAVIGVLIYTAARVGAVARLDRKDFYSHNGQWHLRFDEKNGKVQEIPVRHDLEQFVKKYLQSLAPNIDETKSPLFVTAIRRTGRLSRRAMTAGDIGRMIKRRMRNIRLSNRLSPHFVSRRSPICWSRVCLWTMCSHTASY